MVTNRYFRVLFSFCVIALMLVSGGVFAQRINTYTATTFSGGFSSISGGGTTVLSACDDCGSSFTMPFAFKYDDVNIAANSTIYISTNGFFRFGFNSGAACCSNWLGNASYYLGMFPFSTDCVVQSAVYYQTTGSAPNRVLIMEWNNTRRYSGNGNATSWQVKLYETSNQIEFVYAENDKDLGGTANAGIGLNGNNSPSFIYVANTSTTTKTPSQNLRWSAIPDRQLSVTPEFVDFGTQDGGTVVTANITVSSVGTAPDPVQISNVVISTGHPDFTLVTTPPSSLSPGQSATFQVKFTAGGAGPRGATLLVQSNGRDSGDQPVTLTGFTRSGVIEWTPDRLFVKQRVPLGGFIEQVVIIKSVGLAPLTLTPPVTTGVTIVGGDASQYSIVRYPALAINPGTTDTVRVRYSPTFEGAHTSILRISNGSSNQPVVDVPLRGTGILPHITVEPTVLQFDSVEVGATVVKKFTICNPGSDTLRISYNDLTSADPDFTIKPLTGDDRIIAPEKCREVEVTFHALQKGIRAARFHLVTNIPFTFEQPRRDTATNNLYYDIRGTGVPVGTLTMDLTDAGIIDSSIIGQEKCRSVKITNNGDANVLINDISFNGAASGDYKVTGITMPFTLKAKSSVTVQVCGTPADRGSRLVSLNINGTSSEKAVAAVAAVDVRGLLVCADAVPTAAFQTSVIVNNMSDSVDVTVTNCGDVATTYTPTISGADAGSYTVSPLSFGPVDPNMTATFKVMFTPTSRGTKTASLVINGTNGVAPMTVALGGEGACAVPEAQATVLAPKTKTQLTNPIVFPITVNNSGNLAWNVGTPTITGDAAYAYVAAGSDVTIPANGSGVINVSFHPSVVGVVNAVLTFVGSGPCEENALTINIAGEGFEDLGVTDVRTAEGFILGQNAPNPTTGSTSFNYTVPTGSNVRIILADVTGKTVRELVNSHVSAGTYSVDVNTTGLASGTYLYIMEAGNARLVRQMLVSK